MNDEKEIGDLFSGKFENFEVKFSEEDWLKIKPKLRFSNFLRFNFYNFNIYYLLAIVLFAGTTTFSGISYYKLSKKTKQLEKQIEQCELNQNSNIEEENPVKPVQPVSANTTPVTIPENKPKKNKPITSVQITNDIPVHVTGKQTTPDIGDTVTKVDDKPIPPDTNINIKYKKVKKTLKVRRGKFFVKDTLIINVK